MVNIHVNVLVGGGLFLIPYSLLWNSGIGLMMNKAAQITLTSPLQRHSLFLIGAYFACRVTLLLVLYMILLFCLMTVGQCLLPFTQNLVEVHRFLGWLLSDEVLFRALSTDLLPFHLAVFTSSIFIATVYPVVYTSEYDLLDADRTMSVVVREALCIAVTGILAYAALFFFLSFTPPGRKV